MNSMASHYIPARLSPRQKSLTDPHFAHYAKKQSFSSRESLDTGLTIQTKDGDRVTINTASFSSTDAFLYNSQGIAKTDAGQAIYNTSHREITLVSGQSFSFTVEGDLSEEELEDIESLLKGIDKVISKMTSGDISGALDQALKIGGLDSVAAYSADLTYRRAYALGSEVTARSIHELPPHTGNAPEQTSSLNGFQDKTFHPALELDKFFRDMENFLKSYEDNLLVQAKDPLARLLQHHLENIENDDLEEDSLFNPIESAFEDIHSMLKEITFDAFENQLKGAEADVN